MTHPPEDGNPAARERKAAEGGQDDAWARYMASCTDYIRRQVIIYQNWPQRRWDPTGYRKEKVFSDLNN